MLFKIIFFILFLLGVSLFISIIATIILKKKSRKVLRNKVVRREEYKRDVVTEASERARAYQKGYLDKVSDMSRGFPVEKTIAEKIIPEEKKKEQKTFAPIYRKSVDYSKIKWVFIILITIGILFSGSLFWVKSYKLHSKLPKLYLCEGVDFIRLKPIKSSDRFTRGNITVFFKSKTPIKQKYLSLEIYKLGEAGFVPYAKKKIKIRPEWTSFVATVLFDQLGNYIVEVKNSEDKLIVQKLVEIVPDSYAYKAKPKLVP